MWSARNAGGTFTSTEPASVVRVYSSAWARSLVKIDALSANGESLVAATPAATSLTGTTLTTGPKTSAHSNADSAGTSGRAVGASTPSRSSPPPTRRAPALTAVSTQDFTRSLACGVISGPTTVSGSDGSPVASADTAPASRVSTSSTTASCTYRRCSDT